MVSTQFESLSARRCFPCIDEPAVKAVFGVTLVIDSHLQALSNMPVKSIHSIDRKTKQVAFLDTPIMSTYLLAMAVGEFDYLQTVSAHGVIVSVYTPPGKSDSGEFALKVAARALDAYDDFFHVHFPLPKLDMIAIPEFAMGAMEVRRIGRSVKHRENIIFCIFKTLTFDNPCTYRIGDWSRTAKWTY